MIKAIASFKQERYDKIMRYVGKIEAICVLLDDLDSIEYDAITEEAYDELITQSSSRISEAKQILKKYAEELR